MTKRGKLVGSIVVMLLIAIMIPIGIFATQKESIENANYVMFNVVDFQGEFFIGLIGNKDTEADIGEITQNNKLSPAKLFTAKYVVDPQTQEGNYNVYNVYQKQDNNLVPVANNKIEFENPKEIIFDKDHSTITYYFVFVNTATNEIVDDNKITHDVNVTTNVTYIDSSWNNVVASWNYAICDCAPTDQNKAPNLTTFDLTSCNWEYNDPIIDLKTNPPTITPTEDLHKDLAEPITVKARDTATTNKFQYIIMKYTMIVDPYLTSNINSQFTITINLTSANAPTPNTPDEQ